MRRRRCTLIGALRLDGSIAVGWLAGDRFSNERSPDRAMAAQVETMSDAPAPALKRLTTTYDKASTQRFLVANGSKSYVQQ